MSGKERCDEILRLIDEVLAPIAPPTGPVRFAPSLRTAGDLAGEQPWPVRQPELCR